MNVRRSVIAVLALMFLILLGACGPGQVRTATTAVTPTTKSAFAPTTSTTVLAAGSIPAGFEVEDLTWISDTDGWALGTAPCADAPCTAIAHTTDGGTTWTRIPAPAAPVPGDPSTRQTPCDGMRPCVDGIRFATAMVGYAFGPGATWMTLDGGRHWIDQGAVNVASLEVDNASVFRVTYADGCPPGCTYVLQRSALGSMSWSNLTTPPMYGDAAQVNVDRSDVYVTVYGNPAGGAQNAHATLLRSVNGGAGWTSSADPCGSRTGAEDDATDTTTAPGGHVFVSCEPRLFNSDGFVLTSADAGATFGATLMVPGEPFTIAASTASNLVVEASPLDGSPFFLLRSTDTGATWTKVLTFVSSGPSATSLPVHPWLGFEDATYGHFILNGSEIWSTSSGGAAWNEYRFP